MCKKKYFLSQNGQENVHKYPKFMFYFSKCPSHFVISQSCLSIPKKYGLFYKKYILFPHKLFTFTQEIYLISTQNCSHLPKKCILFLKNVHIYPRNVHPRFFPDCFSLASTRVFLRLKNVFASFSFLCKNSFGYQ